MDPLHLVDLYNQATEYRTEEEQEDIDNLLAKYRQDFSKHEPELGRTNLIEYTIDTVILRLSSYYLGEYPWPLQVRNKRLFLRSMNKALYINLTHLGPVRLY